MAIFKTLFRLLSCRHYIDITSLADQRPLRTQRASVRSVGKKKTLSGRFTPAALPSTQAKPKPVSFATSRKLFKAETQTKPVKKAVVAGEVTHFFPKIQVCVIRAKKTISLGDTLHFQGPQTDFTQTIQSMQINHAQVQQAKANEEFGVKLIKPAYPKDICLFRS